MVLLYMYFIICSFKSFFFSRMKIERKHEGREKGKKKWREIRREFGKSSELVKLTISNIWSAQLLGHSK